MISLPVTLPEGFSPLVSVGDHVTAGQILAQKLTSTQEILNIPDSLQMSPKQARKAVLVSPGDSIRQGDVVAVKKNLFGKVQNSIVSGMDGVVDRYERDTGNLVVKTDQKSTASELLTSPVAGSIDLCNNKEIVIGTDKAFVGATGVSGTAGTGEIFILEESFAESIPDNLLYFLDSRAIGKIILGGQLNRDILSKGVSLGAKGFVGVRIREQDLLYFQEKRIEMPVMEISADMMKELRNWQGKQALVDTHTKAVIIQEL